MTRRYFIATDNLLTAIRREHSCPDCSGHFEPAGDEAANLPDRAGGQDPPAYLEPDPED